MRTLRAGLAALACCAVVSACSGTVAGIPAAAPGARAPESAPAGTAARTADEAAVEATFRGYYQALLTRDWTTACGYAAPATVATLVENVRTRLGAAVTTCEEAFAAIYANGAAAAAADGIAGSARIDKIAIVGDTATITWTATVNAGRKVVTNQLSRIGGKWLLLDTGA